MIRATRGNLLEARAEALVNPVNTQGVMGKGIALQFKRAFPENFLAYERAAKAGMLKTGRVHVFASQSLHGPRWIINFPTKQHWRNPSKLEYVEAGLASLAEEIRKRGIRSIAVPPLGCGNGGLNWDEVRPRIEAVLGALDDVEVFLFEPAGAPPPKRMAVAGRRPRMTTTRAALIALMERYRVPGYEYPLTLLELQKLAYLLQVAGAPLNLGFVKHHYGPYADKLRHVLNHIEGHFLSGFGDGRNKPDTELEILPGVAAEANRTVATDLEVQKGFEAVAKLIEGFETPLGMELLATVHWVATHDPEAQRSADAATRAVQAWNTRKAATMRPPQVRAAWQRLHEQRWLESGLTAK